MTDVEQIYLGFHRLFLRVAGRVPDGWLTESRHMLVSGEAFQLTDIVSGSMVEFGLSLTPGEVTFLHDIPMRFSDDRGPIGIDRIPISDETPPTGHVFRPVGAEVLATDAARIPDRLDLTDGPSDDLWDLPPALADLDDLALRLTDVEDQMILNELEERSDIRSVARAWRFQAEDSSDGVRVVLVEMVRDAPAWEVTGKLQRLLAGHGVPAPQVEVYWSGMELPPYHRAASEGAAVLWRR